SVMRSRTAWRRGNRSLSRSSDNKRGSHRHDRSDRCCPPNSTAEKDQNHPIKEFRLKASRPRPRLFAGSACGLEFLYGVLGISGPRIGAARLGKYTCAGCTWLTPLQLFKRYGSCSNTRKLLIQGASAHVRYQVSKILRAQPVRPVNGSKR